MQIRTTARQPGLRVRQEVIPSRYKAKQAGLDRTLLTAYTGPHNCHAWCALIGSHGHSTQQSSAPAHCQDKRGCLSGFGGSGNRRGSRRRGGVGPDVNPPSGKPGGKPGVLPFLADGER